MGGFRGLLFLVHVAMGTQRPLDSVESAIRALTEARGIVEIEIQTPDGAKTRWRKEDLLELRAWRRELRVELAEASEGFPIKYCRRGSA